jgi:hypothetical protein
MEQIDDAGLELRLCIFVRVAGRVVLILTGRGLDPQLAGQVTWALPHCIRAYSIGGCN